MAKHLEFCKSGARKLIMKAYDQRTAESLPTLVKDVDAVTGMTLIRTLSALGECASRDGKTLFRDTSVDDDAPPEEPQTCRPRRPGAALELVLTTKMATQSILIRGTARPHSMCSAPS